MAQLPSQSSFGDYADWPGRDVLDSGGERLGGVREIYLDRETGRPEWVLVDVDSAEARFVPLADASVESATIRVAHPASTVLNAPGIGTEPRIDQSEERRLYAHYGLGYSEDDSGSGLPADGPPTAVEEPSPEPEQPAESPAAGADDATAEETASPTGWGRTGETATGGLAEAGAAMTPPTPWGTPDAPPRPVDTGAADLVPPWRAGVEAEPATSWSSIEEVSNDAPPPAEPPSPEELEAAEIPEPPAASDRAADYDPATLSEPAPALEAPADTPELAPPSEPPALEMSNDMPSEEPAEALDTASGPDAGRDVALGAALGAAGPPPVSPGSEDVPETPPPAAADTSRATSFDAPAPPPSSAQAPPWTSSAPPRSEPGPQPPKTRALAMMKSRRGKIAMAAGAAAVLFMIIRRLR